MLQKQIEVIKRIMGRNDLHPNTTVIVEGGH